MLPLSQKIQENAFESFFHEMHQSHDFEAQWELFMRMLRREFGIRGAAYGSVPILQLVKDIGDEVVPHYGYPEERVRLYESLGGPENDYTVHHCMTSDDILLWSQIKEMLEAGVFSPFVARLHRELFKTDFHVGAMVPISGGRDLGKAGIGLLANEEYSQKEFDRMMASKGPEISSYCKVFHMLANTDGLIRQHYGVDDVSDREWETLQYSHLSTSACGRKMGVSNTRARDLRDKLARNLHIDTDDLDTRDFRSVFSIIVKHYYKIKNKKIH